MKLTLEDVQRRITTTEDARADNVKEMLAWQKMYDLDPGFTATLKEAIEAEGREQVISSDPVNIINLYMRLISSSPKINVPPADETNEAVQAAEQKERWLTGMYQTLSWQQGSNIVAEFERMAGIRGRAAISAVWIEDYLPETYQKNQLPFLVRVLDPLGVGIHRGPSRVEYAYHKYEDKKINVRARYKELKQWEDPKPKKGDEVKTESDTVCVVDFWYESPETGKIWNCVLVEDEFAKEPVETNYLLIPIIEAQGEDGKSLLHAINGAWQYKCRLLSHIGTAVHWATWPHYMLTNDQGQEMNDIQIRPGATSIQPMGSKVEVIKPDANLTVLNTMLTQIDAQISQATFPGVLYGDAGGMQAGYGVNILSQSAAGRVNPIKESLEMALQWLNILVLGLVDTFASDKDGVELLGRDPGSEKLYTQCLYPKQINGYYENAVQLSLNLPTDNQQKQTFGFQLTQGGKDGQPIISKRTYLEKYLEITVPTDEQDRIDAERASMHPAIQEKLAVINYMKLYPETWEVILEGTPLIDIAYRMAKKSLPPEQWSEGLTEWVNQQAQPQAPPMPGPGGMPPSMGGPVPSQPPALMAGPMGGGIPPQLQGQMTGLDVGLPYHGAAPQFAQMMGNPLQPQELMDSLGGPPPPPGV